MNEKQIVEALIFVSHDPVTEDQIRDVVKNLPKGRMQEIINEINLEYQASGRSFHVEEIAGGWQFRTLPEYGEWIKELLNIQHKERLSGPALETLAVIAYKQPITKVEIEAIRGVGADYILHSLLDRGLIRIAGRKDVIGKPFLYGTTKEFLEHFGLSGLKDLPQVDELKIKQKSGGKDGSASKEVTGTDQQQRQEDTAVIESEDTAGAGNRQDQNSE